LLLIGDDINTVNLNRLIDKVEKSIGRNIIYTIHKPFQLKTENSKSKDWLLIWNFNQS